MNNFKIFQSTTILHSKDSGYIILKISHFRIQNFCYLMILSIEFFEIHNLIFLHPKISKILKFKERYVVKTSLWDAMR